MNLQIEKIIKEKTNNTSFKITIKKIEKNFINLKRKIMNKMNTSNIWKKIIENFPNSQIKDILYQEVTK